MNKIRKLQESFKINIITKFDSYFCFVLVQLRYNLAALMYATKNLNKNMDKGKIHLYALNCIRFLIRRMFRC